MKDYLASLYITSLTNDVVDAISILIYLVSAETIYRSQ